MKTGATGSWSLGALSPLGENQAQQGELCGQHILCSASQAWGVSLPPPGGQARWGAPEQQLLGASFSPASGPHPPPPLSLGLGRVGCGPLKTGPLGVGGPRRSPCFFCRRRDYAGSTRWPQHRLPPWAHPPCDSVLKAQGGGSGPCSRPRKAVPPAGVSLASGLRRPEGASSSALSWATPPPGQGSQPWGAPLCPTQAWGAHVTAFVWRPPALGSSRRAHISLASGPRLTVPIQGSPGAMA